MRALACVHQSLPHHSLDSRKTGCDPAYTHTASSTPIPASSVGEANHSSHGLVCGTDVTPTVSNGKVRTERSRIRDSRAT
jgi:hypothetical protein